MADDKPTPSKTDDEKPTPSPAVEQDNRVERQKAEATATGGGPETPEDGLNQDG